MMKRWLAVLGACIPLALGTSAATAQERPLNVVATIGMIADVAENIGGACVDVTSLMGPGIDPHLYRASARDVETFQDAELILYSGFNLEGQLGDVLERLADIKPTVAVSQASIAPEDLIRAGGYWAVDPHLWMDASLWARIAPTIAAELGALRPGCAPQMQANAALYAEQLGALHDWVAESIASVPEEQRVLVTAHDAFAYYGRAYGIEVEGLQGISTEAEAGVADVRATVDLVVERKVPALFVESTINPRAIQAVIDAAREKGHQVAIGGQLYSDAMGEKGSAGGTYIGMIYENTVNITQALGGEVPPLPEALLGWAKAWNVADAR